MALPSQVDKIRNVSEVEGTEIEKVSQTELSSVSLISDENMCFFELRIEQIESAK